MLTMVSPEYIQKAEEKEKAETGVESSAAYA